ncbi:MerR family transcriptional regulator [Magnetospira sp. QH-2]|uniref:MerR family transcriptional regulator n=1 Tax=Magnetospira sp. (strain QH-2) TaxID=1288970 RepID=UPI0003E81C1C
MTETDASAPAGARQNNGKSATAFRTISEVAKELDLQQHVLRFWETKFTQISPVKRAGGRRYYRPEDVAILRRIRDLLHGEGYTIKGVQKLLKEEGQPQKVGELFDSVQPTRANESIVLDPLKRAELEAVLEDLGELRNLLRKPTL